MFLMLMMHLIGVRINISESYPLGLYVKVRGEYERGSLVETCVPEHVSELMVEREYIPDIGSCGNYPPFIKQVYGVGGDKVEVGSQVSINGELIDGTLLKAMDNKEREYPRAQSAIVPDGHVWLMSNNHPDSYDSRYFGSISDTYIISMLRPLWTGK